MRKKEHTRTHALRLRFSGFSQANPLPLALVSFAFTWASCERDDEILETFSVAEVSPLRASLK